MVLDDRVRGRETEAAGFLLRAEVRIENPAEVLLGNSNSMVGDRDADIASRLNPQRVLPAMSRLDDVLGPHVDAAAASHRLLRIDDQIGHNLRQLAFVRWNFPQVGRNIERAGYVRSAQRDGDRLFEKMRNGERL